MTAQPQKYAFGAENAVYVPPALEPQIRNRVLAGYSVAHIALQLGADERRLRNFVAARLARWRQGGPVTIVPESGKIIFMKPHLNKYGDVVLKPLSLPYVTMHAKMLEARR